LKLHTLDESELDVTVDQELTIEGLKKKLDLEMKVGPSGRLIIVYDGTVLEDDMTIKSCQIDSYSAKRIMVFVAKEADFVQKAPFLARTWNMQAKAGVRVDKKGGGKATVPGSGIMPGLSPNMNPSQMQAIRQTMQMLQNPATLPIFRQAIMMQAAKTGDAKVLEEIKGMNDEELKQKIISEFASAMGQLGGSAVSIGGMPGGFPGGGFPGGFPGGGGMPPAGPRPINVPIQPGPSPNPGTQKPVPGNDERLKEAADLLRQVFKLADKNKDGFLDTSEVGGVFRSITNIPEAVAVSRATEFFRIAAINGIAVSSKGFVEDQWVDYQITQFKQQFRISPTQAAVDLGKAIGRYKKMIKALAASKLEKKAKAEKPNTNPPPEAVKPKLPRAPSALGKTLKQLLSELKIKAPKLSPDMPPLEELVFLEEKAAKDTLKKFGIKKVEARRRLVKRFKVLKVEAMAKAKKAMEEAAKAAEETKKSEGDEKKEEKKKTVKRKLWMPMESDPKLVTRYMGKLGVDTSKWEFHDMFDLSADGAKYLPSPVLSIMLCFPVSKASEDARIAEQKALEATGAPPPTDVYHVKQTVGNACGTIAVIHAVMNNMTHLKPEEKKFFGVFAKETKEMTPAQRAEALGKSKLLEVEHQVIAKAGKTKADAKEFANLHFISFVMAGGVLYELDGRKSTPISHGSTSRGSFLMDAIKIVKKFMKFTPQDRRYNVIALAPKKPALAAMGTGGSGTGPSKERQEECIKKLGEMSIPAEAARLALTQTNWSLNRAVEYYFTHLMG